MFEYVVRTFGYPGILVGTFLEGETILVLGGFAAHQGYLHLPVVVLMAFLGSLAGDQMYFLLGRRLGSRLLEWRPGWRPRLDAARARLERYSTPLILSFRFMYGFRTIAPFAIGMSSVPLRRFIALNAVSAAAWASAVGTGGYVFGGAMNALLGDVRRYELEVIAAAVAVALVAWLTRRIVAGIRARRTRRDGASE